VSRFEGGLEVLSTVPHDSRCAPPGVNVTRHTIFAAVARGLRERGVVSQEEDAEQFGARLCEDFSALLDERLPHAREVPGARELLSKLQAANVPCYVNTATPADAAQRFIEQLGWAQYFRAVLGAPSTKTDNLAAVAKAESLTPAQVVHVGDGDNDCLAAHAFGCHFIGVVLNGTPNHFSAPVSHLVSDMHEASLKIFGLVGVNREF